MNAYTEQEMMESVEAGEWRSVPNFEEMKEVLKKAAAETALKDYRINIRISKRDVEALKAKALEQGIPYQILVAGVLHRYVTGNLKEVV